jgi:hypothetical protein
MAQERMEKKEQEEAAVKMQAINRGRAQRKANKKGMPGD